MLFWLLIWKQNRVNWEPMSQSEQLESQGGSHVIPWKIEICCLCTFNLKSFISERKRDVIMGVGGDSFLTDLLLQLMLPSLFMPLPNANYTTVYSCLLPLFLSFLWQTSRMHSIQFNSIQLFSACVVYLVHLLLTEYWKERAKKKGNGELQMRLLSVCVQFGWTSMRKWTILLFTTIQ